MKYTIRNIIHYIINAIGYTIAGILTALVTPFFILYFFGRLMIDTYRMGFRLAWEKLWDTEKYRRWMDLQEARQYRIDKEIYGWPETQRNAPNARG